LAATYKLAQKLFEDPAMQAEYEEWLEKRNVTKQDAEISAGASGA